MLSKNGRKFGFSDSIRSLITSDTHIPTNLNGDTVLEHVFSEKDLGVIFDSDLSFEEHILVQVRKANSIVGLIKRSFFHLSPSLFRQLYTTFVRPHLEYVQVVWSPKLCKHSKLLEGVQRRATLIVDACKNHPYTRRLEQIGIPTRGI